MKNTWRETEEGSEWNRERKRLTKSCSVKRGSTFTPFRGLTGKERKSGKHSQIIFSKAAGFSVKHTNMSSSILRRHSSKKGLEKLQRITVQRSLEDAEEIERERRRRLRASSSSEPTVTPQDSHRPALTLDNQGQNQFSSFSSSLEEDEGFSDWTHLNRRKQGQLENKDVETQLNGSRLSKLQLCSDTSQQSKLNGNGSTPFTRTRPPLSNQHNLDEDGDDEDWGAREREKRHDFMATEKAERQIRQSCAEEDNPRRIKNHESASWKRQNQSSDVDEKTENKAEMKISYTSTVLLQQNGRQCRTNGQEERRVNDRINVLPELSLFNQFGELKIQSNMDSTVESTASPSIPESMSEETFEKSTEENQEDGETGDQAHVDVQRRMREEERERKRKDVMEKLKRLSISSGDPEEPFSPLSPRSPAYMAEGEEWQSEGTSSITERTESLNRSVKKKNSIKKTQPPTIISKLDGRLEQYNHAVEECCKEGIVVKQMDVPTPPEPVSARKSLFEAGEAWSQNSAKAGSTKHIKDVPLWLQLLNGLKDTEGLKVGVADLINQWVKGSSDINAKSPSSKTACQDVKPGEVRSIKSMWENLGDSQDKPCAKGSAGKRYKFVESGHGKYEKIFINDTN